MGSFLEEVDNQVKNNKQFKKNERQNEAIKTE